MVLKRCSRATVTRGSTQTYRVPLRDRDEIKNHTVAHEYVVPGE